MPLKKNDKTSNMYPWVDYMHSHLGGACPHACGYCYVQAMAGKFPNMAARYSGPVRLLKEELQVNYGEDRTIFVEHMNDLFAEAVPAEFIGSILGHCAQFPRNTYVLQTKNPRRASERAATLPKDCQFGTTLETNRSYPCMGAAPAPADRALGLDCLAESRPDIARFVTVEPILDFDTQALMSLIQQCRPDFVNIGADSKGTNLPEPPAWKIRWLIDALQQCDIAIRQKSNLQRLLKPRVSASVLP